MKKKKILLYSDKNIYFQVIVKLFNWNFSNYLKVNFEKVIFFLLFIQYKFDTKILFGNKFKNTRNQHLLAPFLLSLHFKKNIVFVFVVIDGRDEYKVL